MAQPKPAFEPCRERHELAEAIRVAVDRIVALHRLEVEAVLSNDLEALERLGYDLKQARAFEASLLERYASHVQGHECNTHSR